MRGESHKGRTVWKAGEGPFSRKDILSITKPLLCPDLKLVKREWRKITGMRREKATDEVENGGLLTK